MLHVFFWQLFLILFEPNSGIVKIIVRFVCVYLKTKIDSQWLIFLDFYGLTVWDPNLNLTKYLRTYLYFITWIGPLRWRWYHEITYSRQCDLTVKWFWINYFLRPLAVPTDVNVVFAFIWVSVDVRTTFSFIHTHLSILRR